MRSSKKNQYYEVYHDENIFTLSCWRAEKKRCKWVAEGFPQIIIQLRISISHKYFYTLQFMAGLKNSSRKNTM